MNKQPQVKSRTRELFFEAFWILFEEQPVEQIKVGKLCEKAGYNRSTFYEYFTDIYDLLHQAEDRLIEEFKQKAVEKFPNGLKDVNDESVIRVLVELFDLSGDRLFLLVGEKGDPSFQDKLLEQTPFLQQLSGHYYGKYAEYISAYSFSGLVGVLKYWRQNKKSVSKEELVTLLLSIISKGVWNTEEK